MVYSLVKYHAEEEFCFLDKSVNYYYDKNIVLDYCLINSQREVALNYIKGLMNLKSEEIKKMSKSLDLKNEEIKKLSKALDLKNKKIRRLEDLESKTRKRMVEIKNSKAFYVGEALAWPIRKVKNIIK